MQLERAKFADNGGCGYVLKPPYLRSRQPTAAPAAPDTDADDTIELAVACGPGGLGLGLDEDNRVTRLVPGGEAEREGLTVGDRVVRVGATAVSSQTSIVAAVKIFDGSQKNPSSSIEDADDNFGEFLDVLMKAGDGVLCRLPLGNESTLGKCNSLWCDRQITKEKKRKTKRNKRYMGKQTTIQTR